MANLVDKINEKQIRKDIPEIRVGDTVKANVWVKEGKKERNIDDVGRSIFRYAWRMWA